MLKGSVIAENMPCAQCDKNIPVPEWIEMEGNNRLHFLWNCKNCSYQFQTTAFYKVEMLPIAA